MAELRTYTYRGQIREHQQTTQYATIQGLNALLKLLDPPDALLAEPWRNAMTHLVEQGVQQARPRSPYHFGKLRWNIKSAVQRKPWPRWAAVRSRGQSKRSKRYPRGYPYPRLLNYAPKWGHVGWFDRGVVEPVMARADANLNMAANEIAQKWERG